MQPITQDEFEAMEHLLANLLSHCDKCEEVALLGLYSKLEAIFATQSDLHSTREHLMALQSQKER